MKEDGPILLRAAARFYLPAIGLFALALLATPDAGLARGVGAGLALALAYWLHVIVAGAETARRAAPQRVLRAGLGLGVLLCFCASAAPAWAFAHVAALAGLGLAFGCAMMLALSVLAGRASALRTDEW